MVVQSELHRLPQDQRKSLQSLRNAVTSAGALAQLGCLVKIIRKVTDQAINLDIAECSTDAFVLQGELSVVRDKIQELEQATTLTTQATMKKADKLISDLVKSPDGSPYPMSEPQIRHSTAGHVYNCGNPRFVRAMQFSQRTRGFTYMSGF